MNLKKEITESMRGIIIDHEGRKDEDIVDFYAEVFILIAEEYANETVIKALTGVNEKLYNEIGTGSYLERCIIHDFKTALIK